MLYNTSQGGVPPPVVLWPRSMPPAIPPPCGALITTRPTRGRPVGHGVDALNDLKLVPYRQSQEGEFISAAAALVVAQREVFAFAASGGGR